MATLIGDPALEERLLAERQACGADRYDEVWEGVYFTAPMANLEHQDLAARLVAAFRCALSWDPAIQIYGGVNISDRKIHWEKDYRVPDVAVVLPGSRAIECETHLKGGPDLVLEISSPGDRVREKLDFYSRLGVRELIIIDRDPWSLEAYHLRGKKLAQSDKVTLKPTARLASPVLPVTYRLVRDKPRPRIEIALSNGADRWLA